MAQDFLECREFLGVDLLACCPGPGLYYGRTGNKYCRGKKIVLEDFEGLSHPLDGCQGHIYLFNGMLGRWYLDEGRHEAGK